MNAVSLQKIIELLCSKDLSTVKQGADLWAETNDEELTTTLIEGLVVTPDGDAPFYFDEPGPLSAARPPRGRAAQGRLQVLLRAGAPGRRAPRQEKL